MLHVINVEKKSEVARNTKPTINLAVGIAVGTIMQNVLIHSINDNRKIVGTRFKLLKSSTIISMYSTAVFLFTLLTLIGGMVLTFPSPIHAKISFCASGDTLYRDNVSQCFIKENDCKSFSENNPGTNCVRSKS